MARNVVVRFKGGAGADVGTRTYRNVDTMDVEDGAALVIRSAVPIPATGDRVVMAVVPLASIERAELVAVD